MSEAEKGQLTASQIENWRGYLTLMIGPMAMALSDEDIQAVKVDVERILQHEGGSAVPIPFVQRGKGGKK